MLFQQHSVINSYRVLKTIGALCFFALLNACGAGGASTSGSSVPAITLSLQDAYGSVTTNAVVGGAYTLKAVVTQSSGVAANVIVTFNAGSNGLATLNPISGTALTNSAGVATIGFVPSVAGAGVASANATVTLTTIATGTTTASSTAVAVNASLNYSVAAAAPAVITLGTIVVGTATLPSAGSTAVNLDVYSNGVLQTSGATSVGLTASCGVVSPNVVTADGNGRVSATYSSVKTDGSLCQGSVTLTATAAGVSTQTTINVAAPTTGSITFVSANPAQIFLNSSGASSRSTLTFKVLSSGAPLINWPVVLTLTGNPGGVSFGSLNNTSPVVLNSDSTGTVTIPVFAGGTPGPVTIQAAWQSNAAVYTTSNNFTVASGPTQQKRFSLAVSTFNIEGWQLDGTPTELTVYLADANGNAVPAGTVVNFVAESGQITNSCTSTVNSLGLSLCHVNFISQNPRPADGRVSVLAYLEGVKSYTDNNFNNQFDAGVDTVVDQGDAYRDDNENGQYDVGEFVIPKGGVVACVSLGAPSPARANTCSGSNVVATTVRAQTVILYSSNYPYVTPLTLAALNYTNGNNFLFRLNGVIDSLSPANSLLPMPAKTTVSITTLSKTCSVGSIAPSNVPNQQPTTNPLEQLGSLHTVLLTGPCNGVQLYYTTTTPSGVAWTVGPITVP